MRVLAADDSRLHRQILIDALEGAGHRVVVARDGVEAARLALTEPPDLIVLDVEMPGMTGYQVAHLLKDDPTTAAVPIVFLTSKDHPGDRYWGMRVGAARFLSKSAPREEILGAIKEALTEAPRGEREPDHPPAGADGLLERLAGILDRRLFEAVVTSELAGLVDRSGEHTQGLARALETLGHIADYDVAVMLLPDDGELVAHVGRETPRTMLSAAEARAWETLEGSCEAMPAHITRSVSGEHLLTPTGDVPRVAAEWTGMLAGGTGVVGALALVSTRSRGMDQAASAALDRMLPTFSMVVENLRLYEKMRLQAVTDGLTRAYNHRHFHELLTAEVKRAARNSRPVSLLMVDLDHFKRINDRWGHQCGDEVLGTVAERIGTQLRDSDVLARYGGEEFAILLPDTPLAGAKKAAERVRAVVGSDPVMTRAGDVSVTVSVGVAEASGDQLARPSELVSRADAALYEAKRAGRDRVVLDDTRPGEADDAGTSLESG